MQTRSRLGLFLRTTTGLVAVGLAAGTLRVAAGCSATTPDEGPVPYDGHGAETEEAPPSHDVAVVDAAEPDPPLPQGLPQGWIRYDGYTKACGLFIPKSREFLPKNLTFQPCPSGLNPPGLTCTFVDPSWTSSVRQELISDWKQATRAPDGTVHLQVSEFVGDWVYRLVVDGDGRVEHAILAGC